VRVKVSVGGAVGVVVGAGVAVDGSGVAVAVSVGVTFTASAPWASGVAVPCMFELRSQPARVRAGIRRVRIIFLAFM
jgi:hypothetical protein